MSSFQLLPIRKMPSNKELLRLLPRWQNNTSPKDLGVVRFGFDLFPHKVDKRFGTADWVRPSLYKVLKYRPGMTKIQRAHAVCTSRDFSKSTWYADILGLYLMLVGQYGIYSDTDYLLPEADYIRLRAKTQDEAEKKLANISAEFRNELIVELFGDLEPTIKEIRTKKLKNQGKLIMLNNGYIYQALGLNQPARGANIRSKRPKVDIGDDVENKENTKTPQSRAYNKKEILGEQFGGLADDGLTIYIGNYVHQDCLMAHFQRPNSGWQRQFYEISYIDKDGVERSGWAKRFPMKYIKSLENWYKAQGEWKIFMMEFHNRIVTEKDYLIYGYYGDHLIKDGQNWLKIHSLFRRVSERGEWEEIPNLYKDKLLRVHSVVSGDPAISTDKSSSDGCATVTFFASNLNRYVHDLSLAKFDITDRYYDNEKRPRVLAITPEEMANVKRIGLVSEMGRLILKYKANAFVMENAGQQLAWYNDLRSDILEPLGLGSLEGLPYHPTDEKIYKLETGLLNQFSAGRYFLNRDMRFIDSALMTIESFPEVKLDFLDTLHNAEKMAKFPEQTDLDTYSRIIKKPNLQEYEVPKDIEEPYVLF